MGCSPVIEQAIATASNSTGDSRLGTNSSPSLSSNWHNFSGWHRTQRRCQRPTRLALKTTVDNQARPATIVGNDEAEEEEGDEANEDSDEVN